MMRRLKPLFVMSAVMLLTDAAFFHAGLIDGNKSYRLSNRFYHLLMLMMSFLLFINLFYGWLFSFRSKSRSIVFFIAFSFGLALFVSGRLNDLAVAYEHMMATQVKVDRLFYTDSQHNWRGIPNAKGYQYYRIGDSLHGRVV